MANTHSFTIKSAFVLCAISVILVSWHPWLNEYSRALLDDSMASSVAIFASAKLLNGAISLIQSLDLSVQFVGGIAVRPGELLDPLNDIVETFSWVALAALSSIGMQQLLLSISANTVIGVALTIAIIWALAAQLTHRVSFSSAAAKMLKLLIILRFAVPTTVLLNEAVEHTFIAPEMAIAYGEMLTYEAPIAQTAYYITEDTEKDDLQQLFEQASEAITEDTSALSNSIISLLVAFLLKSMVFPLLFLWCVIRAFNRIAS